LVVGDKREILTMEVGVKGFYSPNSKHFSLGGATVAFMHNQAVTDASNHLLIASIIHLA